MPVHFTTPPASHRATLYYREQLDEFSATHDATSRLSTSELQSVLYYLDRLRLTRTIGRTRDSFRRELAYRQRAFYTHRFEVFAHTRTLGLKTDTFGSDDYHDVGATFTQRMRLRLDSLDDRSVLAYDIDLSRTSVEEIELIGVNGATAILLRGPLAAPVFVRRRSLRDELPSHGLAGRYPPAGLVVRDLDQATETVLAGLVRHRLAGAWAVLERMWCELLLRQRPLVKPLRRVSVEARVRSLAGNSVWVEHTGGVSIGRCPNIGEILGPDTIELRTATGAERITLGSILEIGPWRSNYGRSMILSKH